MKFKDFYNNSLDENKSQKYPLGKKVIVNGFPGEIVKFDSKYELYDVKLARGTISVGESEVNHPRDNALIKKLEAEKT